MYIAQYNSLMLTGTNIAQYIALMLTGANVYCSVYCFGADWYKCKLLSIML